MGIFQTLRTAIRNFIPFFKKVKKPIDYKSFEKAQYKINEISNNLAEERKIIFELKPQVQIPGLSKKQEDLILQKSELLNIIDSKEEFDVLKELCTKLEILETSLLLQNKFQIQLVSIPDSKISNLKPVSRDDIKSSNIISIIQEVNKNSKMIRKSDLEIIKTLQNELLTLSLLKIHKSRQEELREKERIENEQKIEEQFKNILLEAEALRSEFDFEKALDKYKLASILKPNQENSLRKLIQITEREKEKYHNSILQFDKLFQEAEQKFHNKNYDEAKKDFEAALTLNLKNSKCKRRIKDCDYQIFRISQLEEERKTRELEQSRLRERYKEDAEEIIRILNENRITKFFHFTDSSNKNSILQNGGLFSWLYCEINGIKVEFPGGDITSRDLDRKQKLEDFVRLSYTENHPMAYHAKQDGRIRNILNLEIKIDVASLRHTKFSNVNAARIKTPPTVIYGEDATFLKTQVRFNVVRRAQSPRRDDPDFPYYQAEILVKEHIPLEYIINL